MDQDKEIPIADLYPDLSPEEQEEAEYRLLRLKSEKKPNFRHPTSK